MAEEYYGNISAGGKVLSFLMRAGKPMFEDVICPHLRAMLTCRMEEDHRGVLVIRKEGIGTFLILRKKGKRNFWTDTQF